MSNKTKFKVGDKAVRVSGRYLDMVPGDVDTVVKVGVSYVDLERYGRGHSETSLEPLKTGWDYAEADRLEQAARAAVTAYNAYIDRKPEKLYIPMYLPD